MAHTNVQEELFNHHIRVHTGKTQVWNQGGVRPEGCDFLERIAQHLERNSGDRTPGVPGQDPTPLRSAVPVVALSGQFVRNAAQLHDKVPQRIKDSCTLSQVLGGWASAAPPDAVHMIHERHPDSTCGRMSHAPWRCTKLCCRQNCRQSEGCGRIRTRPEIERQSSSMPADGFAFQGRG